MNVRELKEALEGVDENIPVEIELVAPQPFGEIAKEAECAVVENYGRRKLVIK